MPIKLVENMVFSLYGNDYTALKFNGKNWIVESSNGTLFKLKKSQLCDINGVK